MRCQQHPSLSYRTIYNKENCANKRRLLCVEWMIDAKEKDNLASFQQFLLDPVTVLDKNSQYCKFAQDNFIANIQKIIQIIDCIDTQMNQLCQHFKDQIQKIKLEFQKITNQNKEQLSQNIKIKEFQQQLDLVWNMDAYLGTEELNILEKQLNDIIVLWKNISSEFIKQTTNNQKTIQDLTMKFKDSRYQQIIL